MIMRTVGATALALGALVVGASPALGSGGGNDTSAKLRKAVDVGGIKLHEAAFSLAAVATGGNRLAGTRGHELSADYVALQSRLAGLNVSRQDFEYDLFALGDWKPPVLDVRRGKHYIPGIAGSIPGGDFGSMVNSASGDVTAPRLGRRPEDPVAGAEHVDLGLRGRRLRRHAGGRDRPAPARHLRRADQDAQRAGRRRGRDRLHQRGQRRRPRARGPALVRHDRRRHHRADRRGAGRDRRGPRGRQAARASSGRPRGFASSTASARRRPRT